MNRLWQTSKLSMLLSLLLAAALQMGCYSGWNRPKLGNTSGPSDKSTPIKPYAYVLIDAVTPELVLPARGTGFCGLGNSTLLFEYRQHEAAERVVALTAAIKDLADTVEVHKTQILGSDCYTMQRLEQRAEAYSQPIPDLRGDRTRPSLHIKAIFWAGYVPNLNESQLPSVFQNPWGFWQALKNNGYPSRSVGYFVTAETNVGMFTRWQRRFSPNELYMGNPIENVEPTDLSTAVRKQEILKDTAAFLDWIRSASQTGEQ